MTHSEMTLLTFLCTVNSQTDVQSAVMNYNAYLTDIFDKHAPLLSRFITLRPDSKWYSVEIHRAKKHRRSLERKWRNNRIGINRQLYREQCNKVNKLIRQAKVTYYKDLIDQNCNNQKSLFSLVSNVIQSKSPNLPTSSSARLPC